MLILAAFTGIATVTIMLSKHTNAQGNCAILGLFECIAFSSLYLLSKQTKTN